MKYLQLLIPTIIVIVLAGVLVDWTLAAVLTIPVIALALLMLFADGWLSILGVSNRE